MTNLQYYRKRKNLTQEELSKLSKISVRSIQAYEQKTASIDSCSIDTLLEFSRILCCRFFDLYESETLRRRVEEQCYRPTVQGAEH